MNSWQSEVSSMRMARAQTHRINTQCVCASAPMTNKCTGYITSCSAHQKPCMYTQAALHQISDRPEIVEVLKDPQDRCDFGMWAVVLVVLQTHLCPGLSQPGYIEHCTALVSSWACSVDTATARSWRIMGSKAVSTVRLFSLTSICHHIIPAFSTDSTLAVLEMPLARCLYQVVDQFEILECKHA